jgi:dihydrofolate reductase
MAMGRLIVSANMTTDMVIDPLEGWFQPSLAAADGLAQLRASDAVILGRKTYEQLADFWPKSSDDWADLINPMPKHVASRTLEEPLTWNSQLLGADVAGEVANLKSHYSGDLILYGVGELANYLARHDLVDEVRFWLHPVIWGDGVRPFHAGELPIRLELISATTYASGIVRLAYRPTAYQVARAE